MDTDALNPRRNFTLQTFRDRAQIGASIDPKAQKHHRAWRFRT